MRPETRLYESAFILRGIVADSGSFAPLARKQQNPIAQEATCFVRFSLQSRKVRSRTDSKLPSIPSAQIFRTHQFICRNPAEILPQAFSARPAGQYAGCTPLAGCPHHYFANCFKKFKSLSKNKRKSFTL